MSQDKRHSSHPHDTSHLRPAEPSAEPLLATDRDADAPSTTYATEPPPMAKDKPPDFVYDPLTDKHRDLGRFAPRHKKKRPIWKKVLIGLGILLLIGGLGYLAFTIKTITKIAPNFFKLDQKLKGEDEGRVNILLLGVGDPGHDAATLSDTNILVSVNTRDKKVALTSIPRDTRVKIPGYGYAKINSAHAYGDVPLAKETVAKFLDVPIHYYVRTDFTGLKQAVDAVGGIEIKNTDYLSDSEYPCDNNQWKSCGFNLKPGTYQADGKLALKYARCRKGTCGDDFGRAGRQQEVITATRSKALSAGTILNPAKMTALLSAAGDNVKTDLAVGEMLRLSDLTKDIPNDQIINVVLSIQNGGFLQMAPDGSSDIVPIDSTLGTIQNFEEGIFRLGPIWQEAPRLVIENGTKTVGIGGKLQAKIDKDKLPLTILNVMNAAKSDYEKTQIIDYTDGKKSNTLRYLQDLLHITATKPEKAVKSPSQDFVIIVGSDYSTYLPTPTPSPTR